MSKVTVNCIAEVDALPEFEESMVRGVMRDIRLEDRSEIELYCDETESWRDKIWESIGLSAEAYVAVAPSTIRPFHIPLALFGISAFGVERQNTYSKGVVGVPWMIGTTSLFRFPVDLIRLAKQYIDRWKHEYDMLTNFVHEDNTRAIRWLERLGFVMNEPEPFGPHDAMFRRFTLAA